MKKAQLLQRLRALPWDPADYWLVTGGAMVLYGLREETHDIDLGCTRALGDLLAAEGVPFRLLPDGTRHFQPGEELELFEGWLRDEVTTVEGVPVVTLRGLAQMKEELGREKDLRDLERIRRALDEAARGR